MARAPWTDDENDLLVADYFRMLTDDLGRRSYNKAEHARQLMERLENRSKGAIEYKRRNLSAVLQGLGDTWLSGYLPAYNVQASLEDAVAGGWRAILTGWTPYPHWSQSIRYPSRSRRRQRSPTARCRKATTRCPESPSGSMPQAATNATGRSVVWVNVSHWPTNGPC